MEHQSPELEELSRLIRSPVRGRSVLRRGVSAAGASTKARAWFASPDRFLSPRAESADRETVFRVSTSPQSLSPPERRTRHRDPNADPFRDMNHSRSHDAVRVGWSSPNTRLGPPHFTPSFVHGAAASPGPIDTTELPGLPRQISVGAVWNVGGPAAAQGGPRPGVHNGHGGLLASGTNSPMHTAQFLDANNPTRDAEQHQERLALALNIDRASRVLYQTARISVADSGLPMAGNSRPLAWRNARWERDEGVDPCQTQSSNTSSRTVPTLPFRVLDAPRLRDDFYCSTLAYSHTCRTLAVGLSSRVYLWSEQLGVSFPPLVSNRPGSYVTSLSFSSEEGGKSILAVGRQNGVVSLTSFPEEGRPRFQLQKSCPVSCLAFKPTISLRSCSRVDELKVACEDLLIGDDVGDIHYYSLQWPEATLELNLAPNGRGSVVQLARIAAHSQQICGLAWSPDGKHFASGGNDNAAHLFQVSRVLQEQSRPRGRSSSRLKLSTRGLAARDPEPRPHLNSPPISPDEQDNLHWPSSVGRHSTTPSFVPPEEPVDPRPRPPSAPILRAPTPHGLPLTPPTSPTRNVDIEQRSINPRILFQPRQAPRLRTTPALHQHLQQPSPPNPIAPPIIHGPGLQSHIFRHSAAVKALAFAPWQPSLLATGGGSNDRQIHFFHTGSGAPLALINVFAQVTSLIWSKTKREICATFGYAQPDHGVRIAVFQWPSGRCVVSIPWGNGAAEGGGLRNPMNDGNGAGGGGAGGRALWAIAFPGGPNDEQRHGGGATDGGRDGGGRSSQAQGQREGQRWGSRTQLEGCIVVAGSDESVKFHEVWTGEATSCVTAAVGGGGGGGGDNAGMMWPASSLSPLLGNARGVLGGSLILEAAQGVDEAELSGVQIGGGGREVIR